MSEIFSIFIQFLLNFVNFLEKIFECFKFPPDKKMKAADSNFCVVCY